MANTLPFENIAEGFVSRRPETGPTAAAAGSRCALTQRGDIVCSFMVQAAAGRNDFKPLLARSPLDRRGSVGRRVGRRPAAGDLLESQSAGRLRFSQRLCRVRRRRRHLVADAFDRHPWPVHCAVSAARRARPVHLQPAQARRAGRVARGGPPDYRRFRRRMEPCPLARPAAGRRRHRTCRVDELCIRRALCNASTRRRSSCRAMVPGRRWERNSICQTAVALGDCCRERDRG